MYNGLANFAVKYFQLTARQVSGKPQLNGEYSTLLKISLLEHTDEIYTQ